MVTDADGVLRAASTGIDPNTTTFCVGSGTESTCYGENSQSTGGGTTAIGASSLADSGAGANETTAATALGARTEATGAGSTALGTLADASGEGSIAAGMRSAATGRGALAYGYNASASNENTLAIGGFSTANGTNSFAIGAGTVANGTHAIAIGAGAEATGFNTDSLAIGTNSVARGTSTSSFGSLTTATGTNATALGAGSVATGDDATALGAGAATTRDSQIVLGRATTQITASNLATARVADNGTEFDMIVANGDGTLSGLRIEGGATIDPNSGTISFDGGSTIINEATTIVEEGLNTAVTSSADANNVTTYSVSAYNSVTQAGAVADAESTQTASGATVSSRYDDETQTTTYGIEVATGDGLDINDNGQLEVSTGDGITTNDDGQIQINTGSNLDLDSNGALNGYKSTVSASDRKITVTTTGGFDDDNDYTTDYAIGLNISDERFNALQCEGNADGAECYGDDAVASSENTTAIGSRSRATAARSTALGAGAKATHTNSIAIGARSTTTRDNQLMLARPQVEITAPSLQRSKSIDVSTNQEQLSTVMANADGTLKRTNAVTSENGKTTVNGSNITLGDVNTQVQVPSLSGRGDSLVGVSNDGELFNSSFDPSVINDNRVLIIDNANQINQNIQQINDNTNNISKNRKDINKLEGAARSLGDAAEAAGAMGAALSGIPEVSLLPEEPLRCGFAGGGFGSQYAIAGGCAARIKNSLHLNGAIAYSPTVDYHYGSTSSLAGRLGFSFPIGGGGSQQSSTPKAQPSGEDWTGNTSESMPKTNQQPSSAPPVQPLWYRTEVKQTIAKLESDVSSRDEQIELLKSRLQKLIDDQKSNNGAAQEEDELIAILQKRITELEDEKAESEAEDQRQNARIEELEDKLEAQESRFDALMDRVQSLLSNQK